MSNLPNPQDDANENEPEDLSYEQKKKLHEEIQAFLAANPDATKDDFLKSFFDGSNSVAGAIVDLAHERGVDLFHDEDERPFADIAHKGHREVWPLRSRMFKLYLRRLAHEAKLTTSAQALTDALAILEAKAIFEGDEHSVHLRVAGAFGSIYIDLGDESWRVIEITGTSWRVIEASDSPVRFRRTSAMSALPIPERGGKIEELRPFLNVGSDEDFKLAVAWLLCSLRPDSLYWVLAIHGEQGSAKSTAGRILRDLIDPSTVPLRRASRDARDLMIGANNAWAVVLDNLSHIRQGLSDDLCRLATGGGFATRTLYSDEDETLFQATRPVILNGIEEVASSGDLLDRILLLKLPVIPEQKRRTEKELFGAWELAQPGIFGALLDALSSALANIETTKLERLPRMADMAQWMTAAEPGLGWEPGSFMTSYQGNRVQAFELAVDTSIIGPALLALLPYEGTFSDLLEKLNTEADEKLSRDREWPKSARGLGGKIDRLAPSLRGMGYTVERGREAHTGRRIITIHAQGSGATVTTVTTRQNPMVEPSSLARGDGRVTDEIEQPSPDKPHNQADLARGDCGDGHVPTLDVCPVCKSTNIGSISGNCHDCGTRASTPDADVYGGES
jgi:hypothetical protein